MFVTVAFAPGVFWLWFFAKRNVYRPEPKRLLAKTFLLGMLSTIPAGIIEVLTLNDRLLDSDPATVFGLAIVMFAVVGPVEEFSKFLAVRLFIYKSLYFEEPMDGLVYSAAASLGFASLENLLYVYSFGPEVMIARAPLSTLGHVIFGAFWGYALGNRAQKGQNHFLRVAAGLTAAAAFHGLFNVLVFIQPLFSLVLVGLGLTWTLGRFAWAKRVSPFRYRRNYPKVDCPGCHQRITIISRYCSYCGAIPYPISKSTPRPIHCSHCGNTSRDDAKFCTACGDRFETSRR